MITSIGVITINSTSYISKSTKERYVTLRDILNIKPYQRFTNEAEYQLVKYAIDENMSQEFAKYITYSPYDFSEQGLENKLKLLIYKANKHDLTIDYRFNLKFVTYNYEDIRIKIKRFRNINCDQKLSSNHSFDYSINISLPRFDGNLENNNLKNLISD